MRSIFSLLLISLTCLGSVYAAETKSYGSGFFSLDSLQFSIDATRLPKGNVEIAVNCFNSKSCFQPYKGGVWLYNRNGTANTWENQQFSRASKKNNRDQIDTTAKRGKLDKVNVVRVRVKNTTNKVIYDTAYFIGLVGSGNKYPYSLPVVHLLVDEEDAFGPQGFYGPGEGFNNGKYKVWNYEIEPIDKRFNTERLQKNAIVQLIDTQNNSGLYANCSVRLMNLQNNNLPNKSFSIVASKGKFNTNLFGAKTYKAINLRSGGLGQLRGFGVHEVANQLLQGMNIGETPNTPVIVFLNGSYWSLSFAQPKLEEHTATYAKNINPDNMGVFKPTDLPGNEETYAFIKTVLGDTAVVAWVNVKGQTEPVGMGGVMEATASKELFIATAEKLLNSIEGNTSKLSITEIEALIDLPSWIDYICAVDFGRMNKSIEKKMLMGIAPNQKLFLMMEQADDFGMSEANGNHWKEGILAPGKEQTLPAVVIKNIILTNKDCVARLVARYQDLLNSNFSPLRTAAAIERKSAAFLPEYSNHWQSWAPNSGLIFSDEKNLLQQLNLFCQQRPAIARLQLAEQWLPEKKITEQSIKNVTVALDSIPAALSVKVKLNSIAIDNSWRGQYFAGTDITATLEAPAREGYTLIWKEYPKAGKTVSLKADSDIVLTPMWEKK